MNTLSDSAARVLVDRFVHEYPGEVAKELENLSSEEAGRILAGSLPERAAIVLERMMPDFAAGTLEGLTPTLAAPVLTAMDPATAASLLSRLDSDVQRRQLGLLRKTDADELRALMRYAPDSAGSLMDPRAATFRSESTVEQVLAELRQAQKKGIHDVFVVGDDGGLIGSVSLQDLALSPADTRLVDLVHPAPNVLATESREEIGELLETHKLTSLAVVNLDNRLLGVIRHEALMEAAHEEATLDIQTMVGVSRQERALSKVSFAVRKRLPWLNINLATAFLAAGVVGLFEDTISRFTALAVLLPVVAGQSGNTGSQALAVTMRGLSLREIRGVHWLKVAVKEVSVALLNGIAIALVTAAAVLIWSGSSGLALVIGTSMILAMVIAGFAGAVIPMLLTALGQDPAQSSSIILTTVTDVAGFFSFLGIATLLEAAL
jgi:magnesium transporter